MDDRQVVYQEGLPLLQKLAEERPYLFEWIVDMAHKALTKGEDYADRSDYLRNLRQSERIGVPASHGTWIRAADKWERGINMIERGEEHRQVEDEPLRETYVDLCNYLCFICELQEQSKRAAAVAVWAQKAQTALADRTQEWVAAAQRNENAHD